MINCPNPFELLGSSLKSQKQCDIKAVPYSDPIYFLATLLDPIRHLNFLKRKCDVWSVNQIEVYKKGAKDFLISEAALVEPNESSQISDSQKSDLSRIPTTYKFDPEAMFLSVNQNQSQLELTMMTVEQEVNDFMNYCTIPMDRDDDFLEFWKNEGKRWPHLTKLAMKVASVPIASAGGERIFSIAGYTISPRRNGMKPTTLARLMLGKMNSELN